MTPQLVPAPLVAIERLSIGFGSADRPPTVDAVDLTIRRGEIVGLVGESGSGKSLLAHTIAGILTPAAKLRAERLEYAGVDLTHPRAFDTLRGREIGVVFQNPRAALNPTRRVGRQIADVLHAHRGLSGRALGEAVRSALASVGIHDPSRAMAWAGELSGGMSQRVMIAMALSGNPSLLIADEPTTGLDTTTQAGILELILEHARARRMATLFITHDLALARAYCQRIVVMHAGQIVEEAPAEALFSSPRHPYAAALIGATPAAARDVAALKSIPGSIPDLDGALPACRFALRCTRSIERCRTERPALVAVGAEHAAACWVPA